jgi:hypothetical protein
VRPEYTASRGPEFANYLPRKTEGDAWEYVAKLLSTGTATVADIKANVPAVDRKAISGCLRHATRRGAIKLAA